MSILSAAPTLRVHGFEGRSRANGPGVRAVIWVQGCTLACPGCYNPESHTANAGEEGPASEWAERIIALGAQGKSGDASGIQGVSISGGEPLQQSRGVLALLQQLRAESSLSVLLFSGYDISEIRERPLGPEILGHLDVLIDGRYESSVRHGRGLRGSRNQSIHCLTDRYCEADVAATPEAEIRIDSAGNVTLSGVNPLRGKI